MRKISNEDGYTIMEILIVIAILGVIVMPFFKIILDAVAIGNASQQSVDYSYLAQDIFEKIKADSILLSDDVKNLKDNKTATMTYGKSGVDFDIELKFTKRPYSADISSSGALDGGDIEDILNPIFINVKPETDGGFSIVKNNVELWSQAGVSGNNKFTIRVDKEDGKNSYSLSYLYPDGSSVKESATSYFDSNVNADSVQFKVIAPANNQNQLEFNFLNMTTGSDGRFLKVFEFDDTDSKVKIGTTFVYNGKNVTTSSVYIYSGLSQVTNLATEKINWYEVEVIFKKDGKLLDRYISTVRKDISK